MEFKEAAPWQAQNAGDNKTNERLFRHRTTDDLSNYALELEDKLKDVPEDRAYIPGEKATEDEIKAFNKAYGVPDSIELYKKVDTGLDPSVDFSEREFSSLADVALGAGFKPDQFDVIQKWYADSVKERLEEISEQTKANTEKMTETYKEKWGESYRAKSDYMAKAIDHFGGDEFKAYLNSSGLGNFPKVVDFLVEKGEQLRDHPYLEGGFGKPEEVTRKGQIHYKTMDGM